MKKKVDPVVDEAIETLNMKDGPSRRRLLEGAGLFSATAAASALIAACTSSSSSSAAPTAAPSVVSTLGNFPKTPFVAVLVRQPRHHQPVLRAHPVRVQGRSRAAWPADAEVGRLGQLHSRGHGRLHEDRDRGGGEGDRHHGDQRQSQRHDVRHPGGGRDERRYPRGQLQRRRSHPQGRRDTRDQPALLRRAGTLRLRPADGSADPGQHQAGARRHLHRHPGHGQHPAPLRRRVLGAHPGWLQGEPGGDRGVDGGRGSAREGLPARQQVGPGGRVRGGRGLDRAARPAASPPLAWRARYTRAGSISPRVR